MSTNVTKRTVDCLIKESQESKNIFATIVKKMKATK